jgi:nitrate/TMAO reductase-like tetraheme cytochrome c subunit
MKPELVTYQHGPHARVGCVECHIGPGATWFVKSKLSGTYQLYATAFNKYPRPVPTPIKNLRPAQETCEQCHWPKKFVGNLERTYSSFLGDETNTPFTVRMLLNVGGADPTHGPVGGIHWHMNVANKIEYLATDPARQKIPWVRMTDGQGVVTEFRLARFTNAVNESLVRRMDCMDCHNRPAHRYQSPNAAVNLAMSLGQIDRALPYIKTNAVFALTRAYTNGNEAREGIATALAERYPKDPRIGPVIDVVQKIYEDNFFPEMKADWQVYPDNIGHKDWPGCFRCHDGLHKTADARRVIKANDCNACHTILAQGQGAELDQLTPKGQKFKHPGDEVDGACNDCHSGGS